MSANAAIRTSVAPMLSVPNGARAVEFYGAAFGAAEVFRVEDPSGAVVARLSIDGAEFWLADESPEHDSPETLGGGPVRMVLTVPGPERRLRGHWRPGPARSSRSRMITAGGWAESPIRSATTGRSAARSTRDARAGFAVNPPASSTRRSARRGRRSAAQSRGA